jgi:hypothetical protein
MSETKTVAGIPRSEISYLPLDRATAEPANGFWEVYADRWWSHEPGKGLLFFRKSPQCNANENIARKVTERCHPGAEVIFVRRVYVKHDCGDYL